MTTTSAHSPQRWSVLAQQIEGLLGSDGVSTRALDRHAMAHDASHYLLIPQMVLRPTSTEQVAAVLRACDALGAPVTFRSGGTSLSGQALTDAVLVDTRRHFEGVEVLDQGARVRVRPGSTVRAVNARLKPFGTKIGPDPASESACTMGGVVANNSSGMQCGTRFNTYATLESMTMVLPSGTTVDSGAADASALLQQVEPDLWRGLLRLRDRVRGDADSQRRIVSQFSIKNTMGYGVNALVDYDDPVEILAHLMVGSEGTLGFVSEVTLRTVPVPQHVSTGLLVFPDVRSATEAVPELIDSGTATAELLDAASLRTSQDDPHCPRQITDLRVEQHAAILVEYHADSPQELEDLTSSATSALGDLQVQPFELTTDSGEQASLWRARKGLYSAVARARPSGTSALLEDVSVQPERLGQTCVELTGLFERHGYEGSVIFGHARDGNVHFLLNERFDDEASLQRYEAFTEDMVDLVLGQEGSLKAEHGTGRIMAPFVRRQYGDELYAVMRELKQMVDPHGLLNPGSVLSDDPRSYLRDLKPHWQVEPEVDDCVECGYCEPVCPSRDLTLTPRQRIVVRRELVAAEERGQTVLASELRRDYEYAGKQTCAVDGMCVTACPVQINTGDLVRRLRAESARQPEQAAWWAAARGWGVAARAGGVGLSAAKILPTAVPTAALAAGRRIVGPDTVPAYDPVLPRGGQPRPVVTDPAPRAVFFAACIGTMFGTHGAEPPSSAAFVQLCDAAGVGLRTPEGLGSLCCGTPWKSKGMTRGYRAMSEAVLPALRAASEGGRLPVVVDASSCVDGLHEMLAEQAPEIQVLDAVEFVAEHVLPHLDVEPGPGLLVVHPTCSGERAGTTPALLQVARAVSRDVLVPTAWGCCAFAGDRGLLHPELTAAATRREAEEVAGLTATAYASSNRTCELGMTKATGRPYRHVLQLLAESLPAYPHGPRRS